MENTPVSVSEAIALINQTLDYAYPTLVVEGEVASFKVNQGKFVFFDLKDTEGTLGCFMMLFQMRTPLEDGMRVRVVASPKVTAWGKFSLTVREVQPVGEGSLKRAYEILKTKLDQEGLFAVERKRAIPDMPARIAVVSSTQAAGYADFIRILDERWGGVTVEVAHTQVQGSGAADQMIRAIRHFNEQETLPEVLVLIRGGGSADDLAAFNDELFVRAIASSRVPVVVGVGHETDESLADLAADVRAATPSHAAQLIVPDKQDLLRRVRRDILRAAELTEDAVDVFSLRIKQSLGEALKSIVDATERASQVLVDRRTILVAYDPVMVLKKGYALVKGDVEVGKSIEIEQYEKIVIAEVTDVRQK